MVSFVIVKVLFALALVTMPVFAADKTDSAVKPFLVVVDPAHGGSDLGSRFSATSNEKNVTLAFARRLRAELQAQSIPVRLLRDSDVQLSVEQRAMAANAAQPAIFIGIHAGLPGGSVRVFTSLLKGQANVPNPTLFLPWDTAQAVGLRRSREIAATLVNELHKSGIAASLQNAPLAPLNSVAVPAIALELATDGSVESKTSKRADADSQRSLAKVIASVIAAQRLPGEQSR
jgi:N-acetylmuramoyl-L-alanine amidase